MEALKVTFINVGYGEAIMLECPAADRPDGVFYMLMDAGGRREEEFAGNTTGRIPAAEYLKRAGIPRLDAILCTHPHEDHVSGLVEVIAAYTPERFYVSLPAAYYRRMRPLSETLTENPNRLNMIHALEDYREICETLARRGTEIVMPPRGSVIPLADALSMRMLGPEEGTAERSAAELERIYALAEEGAEAFIGPFTAFDGSLNNRCLVTRLDYGDARLLFAGDTNKDGFSYIPFGELKADIYLCGHHCQMDGTDAALLNAIRPKAVICCASSDRRYDSAHPELFRLIEESGAEILCSDCPPVLRGEVPPHNALLLTVSRDGSFTAEYR